MAEEAKEASGGGADGAQAAATVMGGAFTAQLALLGARTGLWAALAKGGSQTAEEVAAAAGTNARLTAEVLRGCASAGLVTLEAPVDGKDTEEVFSLNDGQKVVLADESKAGYMPRYFELVKLTFDKLDRHCEALRTGRGLSYEEQGPRVAELINGVHRPFLETQLVDAMAKIDGIVEMLDEGVKCVELGCGQGNALVALAKRFPKSQFHGYEVSKVAIAGATAAVSEAGLTNAFVHDVSAGDEMPADGSARFAFTYDCIHDMADPHPPLAAVRKTLADDGVWFVIEPFAWRSHADAIRRGRFASTIAYGFSTNYCLTSGMSEPGGPEIGAYGFNEAVGRDWFGRAGFSRITVHRGKDISPGLQTSFVWEVRP